LRRSPRHPQVPEEDYRAESEVRERELLQLHVLGEWATLPDAPASPIVTPLFPPQPASA
jgi:hypothetical protein